LTKAFPQLDGKAEPLRNPLRDLAVTRQDGDVHLRSLGQPAPHSLGELVGRRTREEARDGSDEDCGKLRLVAEVQTLELAAERDLIAPRCR
jgi:hypothetical protein